MEIRRDVFQAIADPTRREIINLLANKNLTINAISENFNMTRQAISLHVKILQECQMIGVRKKGRERICELQPEGLREVNEWTAKLRTFWTERLARLKHVVEAEENDNIIFIKNKNI